ncbi:MAG: class I SAM-dependent methyltransferase [Lachnospiraceae bacterium]|nr:class I SAM-dependent methyltransferase [Lachnospiraceae bacterium]
MAFDYDKLAANWDNPTRITRGKNVSTKIKNYIPDGKYKTAMEFGCGTGLVGFDLLDKFESVDFVDCAEKMIDIVNEKIKMADVKNAAAYAVDLIGGDTLDKKYDIIFHSMALHHVVDLEAGIKMFHNYLNDGGCLCIVDMNPEDGHFHDDRPGFDGHFGFDQDDLKGKLESWGFDQVTSETFLFDHKNIGEKRLDFSLFIMTGTKKN